MTRARVPPDAGFSLLETTIACALLGTALLAVAQLVALAASLNVVSRDTTRASLLAAQKLEQLRALPQVASGEDEVNRLGRTNDNPGGAGRVAYRRRWTVTPVSPGIVAIAIVVAPLAAGNPQDGATAARGAVRFVTLRTKPVP